MEELKSRSHKFTHGSSLLMMMMCDFNMFQSRFEEFAIASLTSSRYSSQVIEAFPPPKGWTAGSPPPPPPPRSHRLGGGDFSTRNRRRRRLNRTPGLLRDDEEEKLQLLTPYLQTAVEIKREEAKQRKVLIDNFTPQPLRKRVVKVKKAFELDEIHLATLQSIFTLLDKDQDKLLTVQEIRLAIVALGIPPSKKLIDEITSSVPSWTGNGVDFNTFKRVIVDRLKSNPVHLADIDELFGIFESTDGKGIVTPAHLRHVMSVQTSNSTQLSDREVNEIFDELGIKSTPLYYRKFLADISSGFVNFL